MNEMEQQEKERKKIEKEKRKEEKFKQKTAQLHYLVSTSATPGVFSPQREKLANVQVKDKPLEEHLRQNGLAAARQTLPAQSPPKESFYLPPVSPPRKISTRKVKKEKSNFLLFFAETAPDTQVRAVAGLTGALHQTPEAITTFQLCIMNPHNPFVLLQKKKKTNKTNKQSVSR
jgi:hypothetical protein